jgi:predicted ABC-type ATPase
LDSRPQIVVIAGPNGAGKSTAAPRILPPWVAFINADEIAKSLPPSRVGSNDILAARLALEEMDRLAAERADFAIETTLASRSLAPRIELLQATGYFFRLVYLWSPSPDFSIRRVAFRVTVGGHSVPEETIRRRYYAGIRNFFDLYQPIADAWDVHDSSRAEMPRLVAEGHRSEITSVSDPAVWEELQRRRFHEP